GAAGWGVGLVTGGDSWATTTLGTNNQHASSHGANRHMSKLLRQPQPIALPTAGRKGCTLLRPVLAVANSLPRGIVAAGMDGLRPGRGGNLGKDADMTLQLHQTDDPL